GHPGAPERLELVGRRVRHHGTLSLGRARSCRSDASSNVAEVKGGHMRATINGVDYTYEVHGDGEPLLLLHGGLLTMDSFGPAMPTLTKGRRVIAVDLQGH